MASDVHECGPQAHPWYTINMLCGMETGKGCGPHLCFHMQKPLSLTAKPMLFVRLYAPRRTTL